MQLLFTRRPWMVILAALALSALLAGASWAFLGNREPVGETAKVTRGDVSVFVSVSGVIKTKNSATLGFPKTGVIEEIFVREGDLVKKGQVLASLNKTILVSEYESALASVKRAEAGREEERAGSDTAIKNAQTELDRVLREQDEIVENARRVLLSDNLQANPQDETSDDTAPIIAGTYTCADEGSYILDIYRSSSESGYSYRLSGLGEGSYTAYTGSASPFDTCGLSILFSEDVPYGNETWIVEVPNTRSSTYATNLNAHELAQTRRSVALETARENLDALRTQAIGSYDGDLTESGQRAEAEVGEARSRLAIAEAKIADDTIRAPFDGVVSAVALSLGEVSSASTGITMTAGDSYELKIRIPEIDITHIETGDSARASFDARPESIVPAKVSFISPMPTLIDGVSYYEALLSLDETPSWMRAGLNADVDIIVDSAKDTLVLPKRFIVQTDGEARVFISQNRTVTPFDVTLGLVGNDGFVQVSGLQEGTDIIAP